MSEHNYIAGSYEVFCEVVDSVYGSLYLHFYDQCYHPGSSETEHMMINTRF